MSVIPVTQDIYQNDDCWMAVQANSSGDHISDIPQTKHGWQSCLVVIISCLVGQMVLGSPQVWWLRDDLQRPLAVGGGCQDRAHA
jgi:hypothetical protein